MNVHMVSSNAGIATSNGPVPKGINTKQQPEEEVSFFEEGTWMSGLGLLYMDQQRVQRNLTFEVDYSSPRLANRLPFKVHFGEESLDTIIVSSSSLLSLGTRLLSCVGRCHW